MTAGYTYKTDIPPLLLYDFVALEATPTGRSWRLIFSCSIAELLDKMKSTFSSLLAALAVAGVSGHATFQQLWVDGQDYISAPLLSTM